MFWLKWRKSHSVWYWSSHLALRKKAHFLSFQTIALNIVKFHWVKKLWEIRRQAFLYFTAHHERTFTHRQWKTSFSFMSGLVFHSHLSFYLLFLFSTHAFKKKNKKKKQSLCSGSESLSVCLTTSCCIKPHTKQRGGFTCSQYCTHPALEPCNLTNLSGQKEQ